jgi:D-alanyl-lipoteichoic acid acyltransferase DltB (MBOAT superfamily)
MLFSSPDYPVFLIAVFFLYAFARWGGSAYGGYARIALMVLLGDILFILVAKDPDALWDPIGGVLLRIAANDGRDWPPLLFVQWLVGGAVLAGSIAIGKRHVKWIASRKGQAQIAVGFCIALACIAVVVGASSYYGLLDEITAAIVAHGHLLVLVVLGVGLGCSHGDAQKPLGRVIVLFVASSLFYHAWAAAMPGPYRYLLALLLATIALDYYLGLWIERTEDPWSRKALVVVSLVSNLGILVFFKYTNFFTQDVANRAFGTEIPALHLILPAGISFHTFQSLSYTIDVYRKEIKATKSIVTFATFVLFFPQLVAGPIVRAHELLPQLENPPPLELQKATNGLFRIVVGLFKKVALADALALSIVDRVFEAPERFSSLEVLAGVYAYALQIYLDFSAYSDIAIGSAMVLGFTIPENFRTPYRSANLQEFWRRWHISLSSWLRDYLYIALGGSRHGEARTYLNLSLTMLLGGLWHGASYAFIVWGALHGFGLAVTRYFQRSTKHQLRMVLGCAAAAAVGVGYLTMRDDDNMWRSLVVGWIFITPIWAVSTAWLGRERPGKPQPAKAIHPLRSALRTRGAREPEALRLAMCASGVGVLLGFRYLEPWTWIPLVLLTWALGLAADVLERGTKDVAERLLMTLRRIGAGILVFHYVCLAWIFFRATSFDNALAILTQLAKLETDRANLVPLVTISLAVGFTAHFFADGSFRWLRDRFVALPAYGQGLVLAGAALVLRELGQAKIVPFIYFQF